MKCIYCSETQNLTDTPDGDICAWCLEEIKADMPQYWFFLVSA